MGVAVISAELAAGHQGLRPTQLQKRLSMSRRLYTTATASNPESTL